MTWSLELIKFLKGGSGQRCLKCEKLSGRISIPENDRRSNGSDL